MAVPTKLNFKIYQGATFSEVIRWESAVKTYASISAISKSAPITITATTHGVPDGWRVKVTNVLGMTDINSTDTYHNVTVPNPNSITINSVNALGYKDYISGGVVEYNQPVNLTGFSARMQLRTKIDDTTTIDEYTTVNGKVIIDTAKFTIAIVVPATETAAYTFSTAVYSLELVSGTGIVTQLATGTITLVKEVTR